MTHFSIAVEIEAAPDRVWAVMRDIERWPEWTPTVTSIERLDHGPLALGSRALIRQPKLLPANWEITELEEGRGFTWVTRSPGVSVAGRHWVEASGGGSRATLSLQFSGLLGPLIALLLRSLNERYLALEATSLKKRSEDSTSWLHSRPPE
jgi:uncharacterized membrane protein